MTSPGDRNDLAAALTELTELVLSTSAIEESLQQVADFATRVLPGHPNAGVSLRHDGHAMTVASTGARTALLEEVEYNIGSGPCLDAIETAAPVSAPDLSAERRWGEYPVRMLAHGVRSMYCHPLVATGTAIGALNLYAASPHGFGENSRKTAATAAAHAGVLLSAAVRTAQQARLSDQLRAALASRSVIDQALGIVIGQQRCTRERAFDFLRAASQQRNVKLAEVAAELVQIYSGEPPAPIHFNEPQH